MIRIAICDDEERIVEELSKRVKEQFSEAEVVCFSEGEMLLEMMREVLFDIVLLDIDMPGISGLDAAEVMQTMERRPLIIFVTSHDELVYDSLQLHPFGFVRKSHMDDELAKVVEDAVSEIAQRDRRFIFHAAAGDVRLKLKNILYFEADGNYIKVMTTQEEYRFRETMQALVNSLSGDGFVRVHKGFLVNQEAVKIINSDKLILIDDTEIPMGRSYQEDAKRKLMRGMLR